MDGLGTRRMLLGWCWSWSLIWGVENDTLVSLDYGFQHPPCLDDIHPRSENYILSSSSLKGLQFVKNYGYTNAYHGHQIQTVKNG